MLGNQRWKLLLPAEEAREGSLEVEVFSVAGFGGFCLNTFAYYGNHRTLVASAMCQAELLALAFCSLI